jgi:hypothetical protein
MLEDKELFHICLTEFAIPVFYKVGWSIPDPFGGSLNCVGGIGGSLRTMNVEEFS